MATTQQPEQNSDRLPAFLCYADDLVGGETALLDDHEIALLILLRSWAWTLRGIPAEPKEMARLTRRSVADFTKQFRKIRHLFEQRVDDERGEVWVDPRAERDRGRMSKMKQRAKTGADARWNGPDDEAEGPPQAYASKPSQAKGSPSEPNPDVETDISRKSEKGAASIAARFERAQGKDGATMPPALAAKIREFAVKASRTETRRYALVCELVDAFERGEDPRDIDRAVGDLLLLDLDKMQNASGVFIRGCITNAKGHRMKAEHAIATGRPVVPAGSMTEAAKAVERATRETEEADGRRVANAVAGWAALNPEAYARIRETVTKTVRPGPFAEVAINAGVNAEVRKILRSAATDTAA